MMRKSAKTQWDVGELFPTEQVRRVLTVSELTGSIRRSLEKEFGRVYVSGEISNLRIQPSGHIYFSIKDVNAQLGCVLFRNEAQLVPREYLQDGQKVIVHGQITVYEARGQYQLRVEGLELRGIGALQAAFERLKQKLQEEGLFDSGRKRELPRYPSRVGLVTSVQGAAIRDFLHVLGRRAPCLEIVVANCRVQGPGAGAEIAGAIASLNEWSRRSAGSKLDLLVVTRGGGSLEDLWAFNEEMVARAMAGSELPVVSAVGHEIDFTISDFVADLRAATPSAAAELVSEGYFSSRPVVEDALAALRLHVREHLSWKEQDRDRLAHRLSRLHPRRRLQDQAQRVDELQSSLSRCLRMHLRNQQTQGLELMNRFRRLRPTLWLQEAQEELNGLREHLRVVLLQELEKSKRRLQEAAERIRLLSPTNILERGYSITTDAETGRVIRENSEVRPGQELVSRLKKGSVRSEVKGVEE